MVYRFKSDLTWSDVTPKSLFLNRRQIIAGAAALVAAGPALGKIAAKPSRYSTDAAPNTLADITSYNNYYEFGTGKEDPAANAGTLTTKPWSVKIDGLVDKPGDYGLEDILANVALEERI